MVSQKLREIIHKRIDTDDEYDYGIKQCWDEALKLISENVDEAIDFVENEASDEEVYWLSEILCDVYDATKNEATVEAFKMRADKMSDAEMKRSTLQEIAHV